MIVIRSNHQVLNGLPRYLFPCTPGTRMYNLEKLAEPDRFT